jgi:Coenzyme PQQ synthesis protein D (PqqD)
MQSRTLARAVPGQKRASTMDLRDFAIQESNREQSATTVACENWTCQSAQIKTHTMLTISKSVRLTKSADGGVLLDVERGEIFNLNPVGARIVEILREGQDERSLAGTLSREFSVPEETVKPDIAEFLCTLRKKCLIEDCGGKAEPRTGEK